MIDMRCTEILMCERKMYDIVMKSSLVLIWRIGIPCIRCWYMNDFSDRLAF